MKQILLIEDEKEISDLLDTFLTESGYAVLTAADGAEGLRLFEEHRPELVLLDIMLPVMNGYMVCERIREVSDVPVIMLTARSEEYDKLLGFRLGADDYVAKPFSPKELMARVNAVLKRTGNAAVTVLKYGNLCIRVEERIVTMDDHVISLPPKEFDLLVKLAQNEHIVLTRDQLLETVWGYEYHGDTRTVDTHVKSLRDHLGPYRKLIRTVWGVGYKFEYREE